MQSAETEVVYRRVQGLVGDASLSVVIPKQFATSLKLVKGDYVKCTKGEKAIIIEPAEEKRA